MKYLNLLAILVFLTSCLSDDTPFVSPENSKERAIEELIRDSMGSSIQLNGVTTPRVSKIELIKQVDGGHLAKIEYNIAVWDNAYREVMNGILKMSQKLKENNQLSGINTVMFMASTGFTDMMGKSSIQQISKVTLPSKVINEANWDNLYIDGTINLVSKYGDSWLHPALKK